MKVIKFRIKHYKSIDDSGDCYFDDKITILAGKNEAGKTAIVEALEDFNKDKSIDPKALPISNNSKKPQIDVSFKLDTKEADNLSRSLHSVLKIADPKIKLKTIKDNLKEIDIEMTKLYPDTLKISNETLYSIYNPSKKINTLKKNLKSLLNICLDRTKNFPLNEDMIDEPKDILNGLKDYSPNYKNEISESSKNEVLEIVEEIKGKSSEIEKLLEISNVINTIIVENFVPKFILFKSFEDVLPSQKSIEDAQKIPIIQDLCTISGLDFDIVNPSTDPKKRVSHNQNVNMKFSKEYKNFWTQDNANLYFSWDSNNIYFWIKENGQFYDPEIRSKGKQWHLAYYIRITARSREGKQNVLLIDEPGIFLHAKAQREILKKLEECAKRTQILYSTHSPYLIPSDSLSRVRLVRKYRDKGTKVEKLTAKADKETLTPILTAIGEDLSLGIRVDKKNSIVVEGFSDYLYFVSFKKLLKIQRELNFIPSVGADSVPHVGSILFGWGLDPIFIIDNDAKGNAIKNKLIKKLSIQEKRIIQVPSENQGKIEDMFAGSDYKKFLEGNISHELGKVLTAKKFLNRVESDEINKNKLEKETINNFSKMFKKLEDLIKH